MTFFVPGVAWLGAQMKCLRSFWDLLTKGAIFLDYFLSVVVLDDFGREPETERIKNGWDKDGMNQNLG